MDFTNVDLGGNSYGSLLSFIGILLAVAAFFTLLIAFIEFDGALKRARTKVIVALVLIAEITGAFWSITTSMASVPRVPVTATVKEVYGIDITPDQRDELVADRVAELTEPSQDFIVLGSTLHLLDEAEAVRLTLAYTDGEWVLLEGDPRELVEFRK